MKTTLISSFICLVLGLVIGITLEKHESKKTEKVLFTQLINERINHNLITARAIRRNDPDDIYRSIEGEIALEYSEYINGHYNKEWRNEFFEKNSVIPKIRAYCREYPESKLNLLFTEHKE